MDFSWNEEQTEFRDAVVGMARKYLNAGYAEREKNSEFNSEGWNTCAKFGIHGLPVPEKYGGLGQDALTSVGVLEKLGYACEDNGLIFSINAHMWTLEIPILEFGTDEQKEKHLPRLCAGEIIGANATSEPGSGSDAYSLTATATKNGDTYLLKGNKTYVSNGPVGDLYLVYARTAEGPNGISAFLVERDFPGLTVGQNNIKMGLKTSPMSDLYLENCEVPAGNRLGREGGGQMLFAHSMQWERSCILASAVGAMERIMEGCIAYARDREQFGQPIGKFQLVSSKIVDMKLRLESARALLYRAAWMRAKGRNIYLEAAIAKLGISDAWVRCAEDAIQIYGGSGYMWETGIERELRDAMGSRIYSGTSEIQRNIIASMLGL